MVTETARILVVDDEQNMLALFQRVLGRAGYQVVCASSGEEALNALEAAWFDLVISDLRMAGLDGVELLLATKKIRPDLPFLLLTAYGTVDSAVTAMKEGACEYLSKPVDTEELRSVVCRTLERYRLTHEVERLQAQFPEEQEFPNIIGRSRPIRGLLRQVKQVADSESTILIQGESGTGKELIARAIHHHSPRRQRPFVTVDCGALPEQLLESELFGYVKGAFTGAVSNKKGLFEEAHGGTLFLDEIGDTTAALQAKLLRVLQESEIRSVGSNQSARVDVRVIAATNADLRTEVEQGRFRKDLYYRLAVIPLFVPPLRQRRSDIPLLASHFVQKYCLRNRLVPKQLAAPTLHELREAAWPGNIRELENVMERAVLLSPGPSILPEALTPPSPVVEENASEPLPLPQIARDASEKAERERIREALLQTKGVRAHAAKLLGISRGTLYRKLRAYHLEDLEHPSH